MKKTYLLSLLLLAVYSNSLAQTELTVGDKMPPLVLNNILNSKTTTAKLQAKKNQLLLIEFWGSTCGTCIGAMPKLAALKKKWGDSLNIILVSPESKERVEELLRKRKDVKALGLPVAVADTVLRKLIPYQSVPQVILVDEKQRIRAITFHDQVTEQSLIQIMKIDTATLPLKKDIMNFDYTAPFLKSGLINNNDILFNTLFTNEVPGLGSSNAFRKNNTKIISANLTLPSLYQFAYSRELNITAWEKAFRFIIDTALNTTTKYCFELNIPDQLNSKKNELLALKEMQRALDHFFAVKSSIETRLMDCWVIKSTKANDTTLPTEQTINETFNSIQLVNCNPSTLPVYINWVTNEHSPVLYEGNMRHQVTVTFSKQNESIEHVRELLKEQGFSMEKEKREIKILLVVQR